MEAVGLGDLMPTRRQQLDVGGLLPAEHMTSYPAVVMTYESALSALYGTQQWKLDTSGLAFTISQLSLFAAIADCFPDNYTDNVSSIHALLSDLSSTERAVLRLMCKRYMFEHVVDEDTHIRQSELVLERWGALCGLPGTLGRLLVMVDYIWAVTLRFDFFQLASPVQTVQHVLLGHLIRRDPGFMGEVTARREEEAGEVLARGLRVVHSSLPGHPGTWRRVRVEQDGRGLFRAAVQCLFQGDTRHKSGTGRHTLLAEEVAETLNADTFRSDVIGLYDGMDAEVELRHPRDPYSCCLGERSRIMTTPTQPAGLLEVAALAFLTKRQVHVYSEADGRLSRTTTLPRDMYEGRPPFTVLLTAGVEENTQRYDAAEAAGEGVDMLDGILLADNVPLFDLLCQQAPEEEQHYSFFHMLGRCGFTASYGGRELQL